VSVQKSAYFLFLSQLQQISPGMQMMFGNKKIQHAVQFNLTLFCISPLYHDNSSVHRNVSIDHWFLVGIPVNNLGVLCHNNTVLCKLID